MGFFLPACPAGLSDVEARRALRARVGSFGGASRCYGPWARSLDDRTSFKSPPPNRDQPRARLPGRLVRWTPAPADRRERPHRLSEIHGRLSEEGTGLSERRS